MRKYIIKDFFVSIILMPLGLFAITILTLCKLLLLIFCTGLAIIMIAVHSIRLLFRKFRCHGNSIPDEPLERVWSGDTVGCAEEECVSVTKDIAQKIFRSDFLSNYFVLCQRLIFWI